jgi:hypothetical protein
VLRVARCQASISCVSRGERERFEVILESIETKIGILADGHLALNEKFDRLEGKVDRISEEVVLLHTDLASVKHRVENIEHHLGLNGVSKAGARTPTRRRAQRNRR